MGKKRFRLHKQNCFLIIKIAIVFICKIVYK